MLCFLHFGSLAVFWRGLGVVVWPDNTKCDLPVFSIGWHDPTCIKDPCTCPVHVPVDANFPAVSEWQGCAFSLVS